MQANYSMLPFERVPGRLVIEMAKAAMFWLNSLPPGDGILSTLSPRAIILGQSINYHQHRKYQFSKYVQTHEEHDNSMQSHTIGALALRLTGNAQGNFYFLSLSS